MSYLAAHPNHPPRLARRLIIILAAILAIGIVSGLFAARPANGPVHTITLSDYKFVAAPDGARIMNGTVLNTTNRALSDVRIDIEFLNFDGRIVGNASAVASAITPKQRWSFDVPVSGTDAVRARLMP